MKVIVVRNFEGWPDGSPPDKHGVLYIASDKPIEVSDAFGAMIIAKGLAHAPSDAEGKLPPADDTLKTGAATGEPRHMVASHPADGVVREASLGAADAAPAPKAAAATKGDGA